MPERAFVFAPDPRVLPTLLESAPGTVLNVNAPNIGLDAVRGVERARLARFGAVQTNVAERGEGYIKVALAEVDAEYEPGTDAALIAAGYATITPLQAVCEAGAVPLPAFPLGQPAFPPAQTAGR